MERRKFNFWLMAVVGVGAFAWLLAELLRVFFEVSARSGVASVPLDGVIQHKVGELMVGAPLFLILLWSNVRPREQMLRWVGRARGVMVVGGLLNALAWYSLRERMPWDSFFRVWCLILLIVGLFGSRIARRLLSLSKEAPTDRP